MSRMDKYNESIPKRSEKNQELYKQIYNAYDEFENLVVPSNTREIDLEDLKKEISTREDYHRIKDYNSITNNKLVRKEIAREEQDKENEIYDINKLLDKAVASNKEEDSQNTNLTSGDYLKKLNIDESKTNLEQTKEMYASMEEEDRDDTLLQTASLSLEILSDLKGDNEDTDVVEPIQEDDMDIELDDKEEDLEEDSEFYSDKYKFNKRDFDKEDKDEKKNKDLEDDENEDIEKKGGFFKIFFLILGILVVLFIGFYLLKYFKIINI